MRPRLTLVLFAAFFCAGCSDTRDPGIDGGVLDAGGGSRDAALSSDAGDFFDAIVPIGPGLDAGGPPLDAGAGDPNELVWRLDGTEVARSSGAEAASTYLFLPHWGRNVQAYWTSTPAPGVYECADMQPAGGDIRVGLITSDNMWANLGGVPERWKTLNITDCNYGPDTYRIRLELTNTSGRYTGNLHIEVIGAGPRAGEVLELDGVFDIPY